MTSNTFRRLCSIILLGFSPLIAHTQIIDNSFGQQETLLEKKVRESFLRDLEKERELRNIPKTEAVLSGLNRHTLGHNLSQKTVSIPT